jgi:hypothetical protein
MRFPLVFIAKGRTDEVLIQHSYSRYRIVGPVLNWQLTNTQEVFYVLEDMYRLNYTTAEILYCIYFKCTQYFKMFDVINECIESEYR